MFDMVEAVCCLLSNWLLSAGWLHCLPALMPVLVAVCCTAPPLKYDNHPLWNAATTSDYALGAGPATAGLQTGAVGATADQQGKSFWHR